MFQISFFFGAGAETVYGMPLGPQYTLDTILSKRSKMSDALKNFYELRTRESYSGNYQSRYMFQSNSSAFREIVERAIKKCIKTNCLDSGTMELLSIYNSMNIKEQKDDFNKLISDVYDHIVIDLDQDYDNPNVRPIKITSEANYKYSSLLNHFSYYGSIEKDFASIINPKNCGVYRFWRLINYFWGAYFSIILSVLQLEPSFFKIENDNKYESILRDLKKITQTIYSTEFLEAHRRKTETENNYYYILKQNFDNSFAITSNYTPFVENYWKTECAYLAGSLNSFEIPEILSVVKAEDILDGDFVFPFLSTQAPIKPIIDVGQIEEYSKAINKLKVSHYLVIIGYGINENDNHINAILRNFIINSNDKKIIYFNFAATEHFDEQKSHETICRQLKLNLDSHKERIVVFQNDGNAKNLCKKLINYLKVDQHI